MNSNRYVFTYTFSLSLSLFRVVSMEKLRRDETMVCEQTVMGMIRVECQNKIQ